MKSAGSPTGRRHVFPLYDALFMEQQSMDRQKVMKILAQKAMSYYAILNIKPDCT